MWVEEKTTKNNVKRYVFYERYHCPLTGKQRRVSVSFNSKSRQAFKQASMVLQNKINQLTNNAMYADKPFSVAANEFIDQNKPFEKDNTTIRKKLSLKKVLELFGEDILLSGFTVSVLQSTISNFYKTHSFSYTKMIFGFICMVFKYSKRMKYIKDIDFLDDVEIRKKPTTTDDIKKAAAKYLDHDELKKVLTLLYQLNPAISLICEFQSLTGLRIGELAAIRFKDYDRKNSMLDINATLSWTKSTKDPEARIPPKNIYSVRKIYLNARAVEIIESFIRANRAAQLSPFTYPDTAYVFTTRGGHPYSVQNINKLLKKINFSKPISTHTFRHTHISMLAEQNVPLKAIMARVGHNEPKTTLAVYTHVTNNMDKVIIKALDTIQKA